MNRRRISLQNRVFALLLVLTLLPLTPVSAYAREKVPGNRSSLVSSDMPCAEGEVLAVVKSEARPDAGTEILAEVRTDDVLPAASGTAAAGNVLSIQAMYRLTLSETADYRIERIVDPSRSTRELLDLVLQDPRVISAEPNYLLPAPEPVVVQDPVGERLYEPVPASSRDNDEGDLTVLQWYTADTEGTYITPSAPGGKHAQLNIPGWNGSGENASGTIAVMDTGIDVTHPDLQGVLYEFTEEQQEKYGCGPYGINMNQRQYGVMDENYQRDVTDHMMHGTIVAGVIAAAWNGRGVSGIANGAKVFAVRVFDNDGAQQSSSDVVRGFEWLAKVAKDVNLKAVNISLGTLKSQLVHTIMANKLGALGVNTVYASGNANMDLDEVMDMGGENNSPYVITVNASDQDGKKTGFSCYGQTSTHVFATGAQILSPLPAVVESLTDENAISSHSEYIHFFPETTDPAHLGAGIPERFDGTPAVRFFDACPVSDDGSDNSAAKEIGKICTELGFDDRSCYELDVASLPVPEDIYMMGGFNASHSVWAAVPAEGLDTVRWIGAKGGFNDGSHVYSGFSAVVCGKKTEGGSVIPTVVDLRFDDAVSQNNLPEGFFVPRGVGYAANSNFSSSQWTQVSLDLTSVIETANYVHSMTDEERESLGWNVTDPGELTGPYLWENGGTHYVPVLISLAQPEGETSYDGTLLYLDNIATGDDSAARGAYQYMAGTSFAAPSVSACLAVIAKDEPASAGLSEEDLSREALERAAKLLASVDYDDDLTTFCRTGGHVDLAANEGFERKAPLITRAETEDGRLILTGYFFGDAPGELAVDDGVISAESWTDGQIVCPVDGLSNGTHVAKITNSDTAISRILFSITEDPSSQSLYEHSHSLPLSVPEFESDWIDTFFGPMVSCKESLYTMGCDNNDALLRMWRYDIPGDTWSACAALPEAMKGRMSEYAGMASVKGKIYVYSYRIGLFEDEPHLWCYDPDADAWSLCDPEGLPMNGQIFGMNNTLYLMLEGYNEEVASGKYGEFSIIDPDTGTVTPTENKLPERLELKYTTMAVSGDDLYLFCTYDDEDETGPVDRSYLVRMTFDPATGIFTGEDLSDLTDASFGTEKHNLTMAGIPNGVALIGSSERGRDTHIIRTGEHTVSLYPRTSCYHTAFTPQAVCVEGRLYVLGINSTEPDVLYFRSTQIDSTQPEPETEASTAEAVTTETAPSAETESVETTAAPSAEEQSTDPAAAASEPPAEETFPTETRDAETEPAAQTGTNSWILWCVIGAAAAVIAVLIVRKKRQGGE